MGGWGMRGKFVIYFLAVLFLAAFSAGTSFAQFSGNIQGVVSDASGAVIAGVTVELRNVDTGIKQADVTSESGNYRFNSRQPTTMLSLHLSQVSEPPR